jgi:hypothetical protein
MSETFEQTVMIMFLNFAVGSFHKSWVFGKVEISG